MSPDTDHMLSPADAAKRAGCGRTSIMRALENKSLNGVRDNRNRWKIPVRDIDEWSKKRPVKDRTGPDTDHSQDTLKRLVAAETRVEMLTAQLEDVRKERDRATADADAQREMLRAALEDMRQRPSIWSRLFRS